ncbi:hypothetical protein A9179_06070 [Pseudomonas alcaligenes]|uniref:Flagellar hook-length control protein-like C-terminal domain-containing protein n=1 Tax=Aquipseudomonas alcaligenes TaxID=43263 RepID=A0ABR7S0B0_AQUAC|nr:flagellar hook-length control protein FliK [Pseudomonas alcaligenes]MBC9249838.1 hypothetical protein [Pseudomonas alcaligenes]
MLQLMTSPAQPAAAQAADALPMPNPAGQANQDGALAPAQAFAVLAEIPAEPAVDAAPLLPALLAEGAVLPAELVDAAQPAERVPADAALEQPPGAQQELTAEQWLLSMLGQQQIQVAARESAAPTNPGAVASMRLPAEGGLSRQTQVAAPAADAASQQPATQLPPATTKHAGDEALAALLARLPAQAGEAPAAAPATGDAASAALGSSLLSQATLASPAQVGEPVGNAAAPSHLNQQLKLESPQAKWGEQMLGALRDNVELQLQQKVQSATIRLDPPELGSLEILLSHESGRLNVQIAAGNGDVARLLQQTSERLRQELVGQNFLQVNVQVSADSQSGQSGQQQARTRWQAEEPVLAAAPQAAEPAATARTERAGRDVLVTV